MENNDLKIEKESNIGKTILIVLLSLIIIGLVGWIVYYKFVVSNNEEISNSTNYTKEYYDLENVKKEKITKEEFESRIKKYNVTCGVIDQKDSNGNPEKCNSDNWYNYIAYIDNGTPYYMFESEDEGYFEVYNFSELKNVKQIVSKVDQYNGTEFAYELNNGDVYYFTPLFDEITIDGVKHNSHLVKVNLSAKLKRFSNIENGMITYGTDIVLELDNNEKYVLEYSYETNRVTLTKYDDYVEKIKESNDENDNDETENEIVEEVLNNVGQAVYKDAKISDELIEFTPVMSKENFDEIYKKDNATCGLNNMKDNKGHKLECGYMGTDNIVAYVQNKVAYVGVPDTFCDEDGGCEETGEAFLLFTLNNIKNASSVSMDFNQNYKGIAYISTTEGDLYYFIVLDSETYSLYKVNIKNRFVKFVKNEEHSIGASYGTRTIFELSNGNRYTINYNYNEKNISLEKID